MMKRWLILISFIVGLIFSFYHLAIPYLWKTPNYSPLVLNEEAPSFAVDETIAYATKVREIIDGNWRLSDVYLAEYKNQPSPLIGELFPAVIMAGLAKLGGGITQSFMAVDFIFPGLIFLGLSYLIGLLTGKKWLAMPGALTVMFLSHYFSYFPYLPSALSLIVKALINGSYSEFIRSFHPQITFSLWLIIAILIWQIITAKKNSQKKIWTLGIVLGLTAYSYIFYWIYAIAWTGLLWLGKKIPTKTGLIAAGLSFPYLINLWQFRQSPLSQDFIAGMSSFAPLEIKTLILISGLIGANWLLTKDRASRFYWSTFYLSGLILFLLAKPLGFTLNDPLGHWLVRVIYPMATINLVTIILKSVKQDYRRWAIGLAGGLLIYQGICHWQYFKNKASVFQLESEKKAAFEWINNNLGWNETIITTSLLDNLYLPVYTSSNIFIPWTQYSLAPDQEGIERFLMVYKLAQIPPERIQAMFTFTESNQQAARKKRFIYDDCGGTYFYFLKLTNNQPYRHYNCAIPEENLQLILNQYQQMKPDITTIKEKYRADYWLWGPSEKQWAKINPDDFNWLLVWQNQDYKLYRLP